MHFFEITLNAGEARSLHEFFQEFGMPQNLEIIPDTSGQTELEVWRFMLANPRLGRLIMRRLAALKGERAHVEACFLMRARRELPTSEG